MEAVTYSELTKENFGPRSLDGFIYLQEVRECWRTVNGRLVLRSIVYKEDRDLAERRTFASALSASLGSGCIAFGAFVRSELVGFAVLPAERFGSIKQYVDLSEFYVSRPFRNRGIGRELFRLACTGARRLGASKLYISAHSAKETIAAYRSFGCVEAEEIDRKLAEKEPCDLQMEYRL